MVISTILKKVRFQKIGKAPVVVLPLEFWQKIEERLEDLEMINSCRLRKEIAEAREEVKKGKVVPFDKLCKDLGL